MKQLNLKTLSKNMEVEERARLIIADYNSRNETKKKSSCSTGVK